MTNFSIIKAEHEIDKARDALVSAIARSREPERISRIEAIVRQIDELQPLPSDLKITRAALRQPDGRVVSAPPPKRHHHLLRAWGEPHGWEQGFLSSDGKFRAREEAKRIAIAARQTTDDGRRELFTEDLW